jgi:hypothetical protein
MSKVWTRMMIVVLAQVPTAAAHPGHGMGDDPHGWLHTPIGPLHVGVTILLVAWLAGTVVLAKRARVREH